MPETPDWDEELAEVGDEPEGTYEIDLDSVGTWVEREAPNVGYRIQQYAKQYGWDGEIIEDPSDELYYTRVGGAQDYLTSRAPGGFFFGTNREGDWGLWEIENPEEQVAKQKDEDIILSPLEEDTTYEEEKDVMEMTDADREQEIAKALEGEQPAAKQPEEIAPKAAIDPNKLVWSREGDEAVSKDEVGNIVSRIPWNEFEQKSPEVAGKVGVQASLMEMTILSEFHDDLHPIVANAVIDNGARVFIKPLSVFGTVVRSLDESTFRVEAHDKIATYFRQELEVRAE